jgi:predicted ATPase
VQKQIIVIIGGPGTGKSTIIEQLKKNGYRCFDEISRQVTLEAQKQGIDQLFLENPLLFSQMLLQGRIQQFDEAVLETSTVFIDRGIPDVLAYMNYIGDSSPPHFEEACLQKKYDKIFILPPWEEIYESDTERYENFSQAKEIHNFLIQTYQKYGYNLIEVPKDIVEKRVEFILNQL